MENKNTKKRDSNFELLRIISMIMIICLHFNGKGQILNGSPFLSKVWYISNITEFASIIAVNLYVLITGYYMVKTKMKLKRMLQLELEIIFYSVGIYIILLVIGKIEFNKKEMLNLCFPIITEQYWFMTAYMGLYLIIPFLNKLVENLKQKDYKYLIIILTVLLSVIKTINPKSNTLSTLNGYTLTWFIYLYLFGGYIRNYHIKKDNKIILAILYIFIVIVQLLVKIMLIRIGNYSNYIDHLLGYDNFFILIESLIVFLFFKNLNIKNSIINKIILFISPLTLGVYLIHEHSFFRTILWNEICKPYLYLGSGRELILITFIQVFCIFIICCFIEYIRKKIFEIIGKIELIKSISCKIENLENKR